jgi:hypothetical protein
LKVEKSRYVKEQSKIPISVTWDGGIAPYSGLLDVGLAGGYICSPSSGWYSVVDRTGGDVVHPKVRKSETMEESFWLPIFENTDFRDFVKQKFCVGGSNANPTDNENGA